MSIRFQGEGLIAAAESSSATDGISREEADDVISRGTSRQGDSDVEASTSYSMVSGTSEGLGSRRGGRTPDIRLVCIDMDGDAPPGCFLSS